MQGSAAVCWIMLGLRMYMNRQTKPSWGSSCGHLSPSLRPVGRRVSILSRSIAQPGFSRRGGPIRSGSLCRSRWHWSFGIAIVDIWMVATLIRLGVFSQSKQSALMPYILRTSEDCRSSSLHVLQALLSSLVLVLSALESILFAITLAPTLLSQEISAVSQVGSLDLAC